MLLILEAAAETGDGYLKRMKDLLVTTVDEIKQDMFNEAKKEVLKKFNNLKVVISNSLRQVCI